MILDACCGGRMMWFNRAHEEVVYGDVRCERHELRGKGGERVVEVKPQVRFDFRSLPFADGLFNLVVFDPPHVRRRWAGSGFIAAHYGSLGDRWRYDLRKGFTECWRVLKGQGVLVFKWSEPEIKLAEVLALFPERPLFGNRGVDRHGGTHWMLFMKGDGEARALDLFGATE